MNNNNYALILGASSGFGEAVALAFAEAGWNIIGVHLDRAQGVPNVERIVKTIEAKGRKAFFYNVNAADAVKRAEVLDDAAKKMGDGKIEMMLHSLAFGTLKPYIAEKPEDALSQKNMEMTNDVMAHSLVYWTQDVLWRKLFAGGAKIFAMTSGGGTRVLPAYGAVSAAKASLESHIRQLAMELAPYNISANAICAGVTDTPALRKIPGTEIIIRSALTRNPYNRLTKADDVAKTLVAFCSHDTTWMTGNTIRVDGGEGAVDILR